MSLSGWNLTALKSYFFIMVTFKFEITMQLEKNFFNHKGRNTVLHVQILLIDYVGRDNHKRCQTECKLRLFCSNPAPDEVGAAMPKVYTHNYPNLQ